MTLESKQRKQPPGGVHRTRVFSGKFAAYSQTPFVKNTSGWLLLKHFKTSYQILEAQFIRTIFLSHFECPRSEDTTVALSSV